MASMNPFGSKTPLPLWAILYTKLLRLSIPFVKKIHFLTEKAIDNKTADVILYIIKKAKEFICVRKTDSLF